MSAAGSCAGYSLWVFTTINSSDLLVLPRRCWQNALTASLAARGTAGAGSCSLCGSSSSSRYTQLRYRYVCLHRNKRLQRPCIKQEGTCSNAVTAEPSQSTRGRLQLLTRLQHLARAQPAHLYGPRMTPAVRSAVKRTDCCPRSSSTGWLCTTAAAAAASRTSIYNQQVTTGFCKHSLIDKDRSRKRALVLNRQSSTHVFPLVMT